MFYGAFVLAKKGPLAKVWLAAHWDKKLTKAHIFETDVEETVDNIISPKVKMALRTSGHLLLGVVRIYSRKQKYLIHDLGEACAKIRMAFRPGIVDLPAEGAVANTDAITLPEIFHDFETAVADLGSLDMEDQFTINPSRASEITMAEEVTTATGDMFGEFGEFDLGGEEFGGGMEDIEVRRRAITFADEKGQTDEGLSRMRDDTTLQDDQNKTDHAMEDQLPDQADFGGGDFLEDGFGWGDGGLGGLDNLGAMPSVSDITLEGGQKEDSTHKKAETREKETEGEVPMDVDHPPAEGEAPNEEPTDHDQTATGDVTLIPREEDGFILEPVEVASTKERPRRKRKLVVDTAKQLMSSDIKAQLDSSEDIVQQKCFPPPTKKALLWKDMASCEQLFLKPTFPFVAPDLFSVITRNYSTNVPGAPVDETLIDLEHDVDTTVDIEKKRSGHVGGDTTIADVTAAEGEVTRDVHGPSTDFNDMGMADDMRPFDLEDPDNMGLNGDMDQLGEDATTRVIPELPDLEGVSNEVSGEQETEEQQSNELSEEFEQRRWTKRTQQVLRMLNRGLSAKESIGFSTVTQRCNRKQAASRFYTCLLLAKEGTIHVEQSEPYAEILIQKGPKFTEAF